MRFCSNCGNPLPDDAKNFCPHCGFSLSAAMPTHQPEKRRKTPVDAPGGLDKATFLKTYSSGRRLCIAAAIIGYVCTGMTILAVLTAVVSFINTYALLDAMILLTLSLLVHLLRSRIAACLLLVYALFNVVFMTIQAGTLSGWFGLVAGILAVVGAFRCSKEWKDYRARSYEATSLFRS